MSLLMKMTTRALRLRSNDLRSESSIQQRVAHRKPYAPIPRRLRTRCDIHHHTLDGMPVTTLTPKRGRSQTNLIYLHGGAYVAPLIGPHWSIIGRLVELTGAAVTVPYYPLAPTHTAAQVFPRMTALYDRVRSDGNPTFLAGDSAGGGLALSLAIQLRDTDATPPDGLVLFSPWLDVTMSNPDIHALEPRDPMLAAAGLKWCGQAWAGDLATTDPRISPVYDGLTELPPIRIYQGGQDIFVADAVRFEERAKEVGADVQLTVYPDAFHVFVGATFTSEARQALAAAADIVAAKV